MSYGVMFHHFHGGSHPEVQGSISGSDLGEMIEFLGPENVLSAPEWLAQMKAGKLRPEQCCLTFDDALKCQLDVALPVLEEYNLTSFWFVSTSVFEGGNALEIFRLFRTTCFDDIDQFYEVFFAKIVSEFDWTIAKVCDHQAFDGYLSEFPFYTLNDRIFRFLRDILLGSETYHKAMWQLLEDHEVDVAALGANLWLSTDDVRRLASKGHLIGLHSHNHPTDIASLSDAVQLAEYQENAEKIQQLTGIAPELAAYPCNSYNAASKTILKSLGVDVAFRSNMKNIEMPNLFEVPREDHINIMAMVNARAKS